MYAGQGNWAIIADRKPVALLKQGANVRKRSFLEISPVSIDCWKSWANNGPYSSMKLIRPQIFRQV